jgi:PKD repeat protein
VHTFAAPGNYIVCLAVEDSCGTSTHCDTVTIDCVHPLAGFDYEYSDTTFTFFDTTICSNPISWQWDFGDGNTSALQNPVHAYAHDGIYNVCLTVSDSCGNGTACSIVSILLPLKPGFSAAQVESNDLKVTFSDKSVGASQWSWDFGDGRTSDEQNPVHLYDQYGDYLVCLTAGNQKSSISVCDTLKLNKIIHDARSGSIVFFPNPYDGSGSLYFTLPEDTELAEITLTDYAGKIVLKQDFMNIRKNEPATIDISRLSKGTYLCEVTYNNYRKTLKLTVK